MMKCTNPFLLVVCLFPAGLVYFSAQLPHFKGTLTCKTNSVYTSAGRELYTLILAALFYQKMLEQSKARYRVCEGL